jgi:hypothetical protein
MMLGRIARLIRCVLTAVVVFGITHAANAQITGATLTAGPPTYTGGYCPASVSYTGKITGTPGTTFTYNFVWIIGTQITFSGDFPVTMPSSGSVPVQWSMTFGDTISGDMQVEVKNISGGQNPVVGDAPYSVTCKTNPGVLPPNGVLRKTVTLHPEWFALRHYEYKYVGIMTELDERGTAPCTDLCIGWDHTLSGSFLWLLHWNTYDRAFWGYDPATIRGLHVSKATATLMIDSGDTNCYGGLGRAVLTRTPAQKGASETFNAPYPDDGDFNWPTPITFGSGSATVDVTSIVRGWAMNEMPNQGFVIRGKDEDNGANDNNSCFLNFGRDVVLTIEQ